MSHFNGYSFLILASFCYIVFAQLFIEPEQIHISYGASPSEMTVTWVTMDLTDSIVEYGTNSLNAKRATGNATQFVDGGSLHRKMYVHRVNLTDLTPGTKYIYHCGSSRGWSDIFYFTAMKNGTNWSPSLAIYGDMGNTNAQSLGPLQEETQLGYYDAILHVGDFAYDMFSQNATVGDEFMRQIQSIAAYVPYMTCPGNHEEKYNFSNYKNRFSMPGGDGSGMYYSFNLGPAHIIAFSTEVYFFYVTTDTIQKQYEWLKQDLEAANELEARAARPWIITMGHRPMYCSNSNDPNMCTNIMNKVRKGSKEFPLNLEDLFYKYGVDLQLYAHEHSYERLWPLYNMMVCNGSHEHPYTNPKAPVHIITGSAGCDEDLDPFVSNGMPWSAFRRDDYGYTRMKIFNKTHLFMDQVSVDKGGEVIDTMWLIKDRHGAGTYNCTWG